MNDKARRIFQGFFVCLLTGVLFLASSSPPAPVGAQETLPFDVRDHPIYLLASYYNAITLQEYARAYSYWDENAPDRIGYAAFAQGFANVQTARALARLPIVSDVAAGTAHAEVPVVVQVTLKNGVEELYAGCFHVIRRNAPIGDPPVIDPNWYLYSATLQPAAGVDFVQATDACMLAESFPTPYGIDDQLSPPDLISSYYDAIAAGDYARAYAYWDGGPPGQTLPQFAQGFAGTEDVGVVVALSFHMDAAAGSAYTDFPLLITATNEGLPQLFVGCVVARKSNVPVGDATSPDPNWSLYSADIQPVGTLNEGVQQVWEVCTP